MRIRYASDFHIDFWKGLTLPEHLLEIIPPLPSDPKTALCIAGDLGPVSNPGFVQCLERLSKRFLLVLYVPGNRDFYYHEIDFDFRTLSVPENVHILQDHVVEIDNVIFFGTTLWTNFQDSDPEAMSAAEYSIMDFRCIRDGASKSGKFTALSSIQRFNASIEKLRELIHRGEKKLVVISHHLPSYSSVSSKYTNSDLNPAFASELDSLISELSPRIWIHGHTHTSLEYRIGSSIIACNPYGCYNSNDFNPEYHPTAMIAL